jgi:hypothetical protein
MFAVQRGKCVTYFKTFEGAFGYWTAALGSKLIFNPGRR